MKKRHPNYAKHLLQWGVLALIVGTILYRRLSELPVDVEAYCPFGGLEALSTYLKSNTLACSMSMLQIMMGITLAVGVILFSKLFCGYLCPLGTVSEWLGKLGAKCHCGWEVRSGSAGDRLLRIIKYVLLFVIFYYTLDSSELFCKKFDPYYAMATGFKGEIIPWLSATMVGVLFLGSFFIRMFWCRYICPLGAISNIFKFTPFFVLMMVGAWGLTKLGVERAWVWVLAGMCGGGYLLEALKLRSCFFPVLIIERDEQQCNGCGLCEKRCPYHIELHDLSKVRHIDCTMCGNCVSACPSGALQVRGRRSLRWLPALLAVALFGAALYLGNKWELPTIDEKWGENRVELEKEGHLATFRMEGLQTIKCFGSSKALSAKLQGVAGIYGVKTFVRSHSLEILYDTRTLDERKLQELLFTPTIRKYRTPEAEVTEVEKIVLGVEGLRDRMDMIHFGLLFLGEEAVYGFTSQFDCPVRVELFVDPARGYTAKELKALIEVKEYLIPNAKPDAKPIPMHFDMVTCEKEGTLPRGEFLDIMFEDIKKLKGRFVENTEKWGDSTQYPTAIYEVPMSGIEKMPVRMGFPYFKSFLSTREGILAVDFMLRDEVPTLQLTYVKSLWDDARLWQDIFCAEKWTLRMADGTFKEADRRIAFQVEGKTVVE